MANVIEIIIRAKDQTAGAIASASKELGALNAAGKVSAVQFAVIGAAVAASVGTFTALAGAATSAAERLDRLNAISQQTGVAASTLSQLEFAASQTNASIEGLNTGLRFLARNLFEARAGGEEQAKSLRALGFSAKDVADGLGGTEQALFKIADRLSKIQDPGTRAALALKLLGRGAAELIPLLSQGEAGIRAYMARSDELGITVSDAAAVMGDDFKDAIATTRLQIEGLRASIAEALLPAMTEAVEGTQGFIAQLTKYAQSNPSVVKSTLETAASFATIFSALAAVSGVVATARAALSILGLSVGSLAAAGGPIALAIAALVGLIYWINITRNEAREELRLKVGLDGAEAVEADLRRLMALREQYRKQEASAPKLSPVGSVLAAAVSLPFSRQQNDALRGISKDASEAASKVDELDKSINDATRAAAASSFMGKESPFKPILDGAKAATDKTKGLAAAFSAALADAFLVSNQLGASILALTRSGGEFNIKFPVESATKLIDTLQKGLLPILNKKYELKIDAKLDVGPDSPARKPGAPVPGLELGSVEPLDLDPNNSADKTSDAIAQIIEQLEAAGVSAEGLNDALARGGDAGFMLAAGFEAAFVTLKDRLDPTLNFMADMSDAAFEFADTFVNSFGDAIDGLLSGGQKFASVFGNLLRTIGEGVKQIVKQIIAAVAQAFVLKILTAGLFSGGGTLIDSGSTPVPRVASTGGTVPALASGGSVRGAVRAAAGAMPRLNTGGSIVTHLAAGGSHSTMNIVHAANGLRVVPGTPQAFDSVPAMLAPGEAVLPTIGGRMPGDLLAGLAQLGKDLSMVLARSFVPPGPQMATAGNTYNIQTLDAASFRTHARRGAFAREMALASDPARD